MKIKEFTGKTTQEAIDNGLAELGVTLADVHVDVLQEGAKGLFGLFGSKPACVRLTVMEDEHEDDHGLSDLLGSFSLNDQKKKPAPKPTAAPKAEAPKPDKKPEAKPTAPKSDVKAEAPKAAAKPEVPKAEAPKAEAKPEVKPEAPKAEAKPEKKPEALKPLRERKPRPPRPAREEGEKRDFAPMVPAETFAPTEPPVIHPEDTPAGRAQKFLMDVTDRMGVKVDVYVDDSKADNLSVHMIGDTLGILIGRRGETLDALQYLTSLQVNKGREGYIRVTLDTENYRAKREDSLRRLAQRMANRAVKTGRRVVLEPMNPYERRVLHTALQNHPAVTTHSEGEEPNRRVVIMLKNQPERPEKSADQPRGDRPNNRRRSNRRRGPRKPMNENQPVNETQETVAAPESPAAVDVLGVEE